MQLDQPYKDVSLDFHVTYQNKNLLFQVLFSKMEFSRRCYFNRQQFK